MSTWLENLRSQQAAILDGVAPKVWEPPCEHCGASYKLTPGGRWYIQHLAPWPKQERPLEAPKRVGEAEGVSDIVSRIGRAQRQPGDGPALSVPDGASGL